MEFKIYLLLGIFMFLLIILLVFSMKSKKVTKIVQLEKNKLINERYPELSKTEKKHREATINQYYRYSFKELPKYIYFFPFILLVCLFMVIFCIFRDHASIAFFWLAILSLSLSFNYLLTPEIEKQQAFWTDYLEKHPDNPLKVILYPTENRIRLYKLNKIKAIYGIIFGLYTLFLAGMLFFVLNL